MIYKLVIQQLRQWINSDEFQIGERLPAEQYLAVHFNVSRMTLRKAVEHLVAEGMLNRKHGSGTYIQRKDLMPENIALCSFAEQMSRMGRTASNVVTLFQLMPAPPVIARQLRIQPLETIYFAQRVRYIDNQPHMIEDSYLPMKLFPNLSVQHLQGSKFAYIEEERQIAIAGSHESFSAVLADTNSARLLNTTEGTPLLQITSLSNTMDGDYFDLSVMLIDANQYRVGFYMQRYKPT